MNKKHRLFKISLATTRTHFYRSLQEKISLALARPFYRSLSLSLRGVSRAAKPDEHLPYYPDYVLFSAEI